jgi:hypothetical protein
MVDQSVFDFLKPFFLSEDALDLDFTEKTLHNRLNAEFGCFH